MDGDYRRISVYDVTALRIHPNGYRVHQTEHNSELGRYPHNIQSTRGWIADDAGGSIGIPKYRSQKPIVSSEFEYIEAQQGEERKDVEEDEPDKESVSGKGKRKKKQNNMGPIKRRRFTKDDSYLSTRSLPSHGLMDNLGVPSQDLLKNIHYASAEYYDERGLLVNAAKMYRKERKLRKLHKEGTLAEALLQEAPDSQDAETTEAEPVIPIADKQYRKFNRDMYKVLDGSVLVAIGVLTQEVVKKFVGSKRRSKRVEPLPSSNDEVDEADGHEDDPTENFEDEEDMGATQ